MPRVRQPSGIEAALRRARRAHGWSQRELARRTGLSQASISLIENGRGDPQLSTLSTLATALGLELRLVPRGRALADVAPKAHAIAPPISVLDEVRVPDPDDDAVEESR
ncbi:helix-turn-helix transcriptional regulator [Myxococcota bacterium]|nr:helix-turn-helix transcriptional regulator [Myxococcota bacterium]